jgi:hypothetical protein
VCLGVGRPPKTPLVDVEPMTGEDSRYTEARATLEQLLMHKGKTISRVDWIDCGVFNRSYPLKDESLDPLQVDS